MTLNCSGIVGRNLISPPLGHSCANHLLRKALACVGPEGITCEIVAGLGTPFFQARKERKRRTIKNICSN